MVLQKASKWRFAESLDHHPNKIIFVGQDRIKRCQKKLKCHSFCYKVLSLHGIIRSHHPKRCMAHMFLLANICQVIFSIPFLLFRFMSPYHISYGDAYPSFFLLYLWSWEFHISICSKRHDEFCSSIHKLILQEFLYN